MKEEQEILKTAFLLFLEKGFSESSTNEIIREAGLTKGGFYYAFKSREDLVEQVIREYIIPYFSGEREEMEAAWVQKATDTTTEQLLEHGFFEPMSFSSYQKRIGTAVPFRNFYFLLYEGLKKYDVIAQALGESKAYRQHQLMRILERGKQRKELPAALNTAEYTDMIVTMAEGITALQVLDEKIDDNEKYIRLLQHVWHEMTTAKEGDVKPT